MDYCHAPGCEYLRAPFGVAIESETVLSMYHNGPSWTRILGVEKEIGSTTRGEVVRHQKEATVKIVEMAKQGKIVGEIIAELGVNKIQVQNAIARAREKGELPRPEPKKLINHSKRIGAISTPSSHWKMEDKAQAVTEQANQETIFKLVNPLALISDLKPVSQNDAADVAELIYRKLMAADGASQRIAEAKKILQVIIVEAGKLNDLLSV